MDTMLFKKRLNTIDCSKTTSDFECPETQALLKVDQSMTLKLSANQPILKKLGTL
jgi:hypothetical protein